MQSLIGPFGDEAVAGLIGVAITALVAIVLHYRGQTKPKHIVCVEMVRTSLFYVREEAEAKTKVRYNDIDVKQLSLVKLRLYNSGSEEICEPWIKIIVKGPKRILDIVPKVSPERPTPNLQVIYIRTEGDDNASEIEFQLDYVNAYSDHREEILIDLVSDGEVESLDVLGSGAGWSVQFKSQEALTAQLKRFNFAFLLAYIMPPGLYFLLFLWTAWRSGKLFGIPDSVSLAFMSTWMSALLIVVLLARLSGFRTRHVVSFHFVEQLVHTIGEKLR
jgi:hypothetical protein